MILEKKAVDGRVPSITDLATKTGLICCRK